jgi:hypothetical protein
MKQTFILRPRGLDLPQRGPAMRRENIEGAHRGERPPLGRGKLGAAQKVIKRGESPRLPRGDHRVHRGFAHAFHAAQADAYPFITFNGALPS